MVPNRREKGVARACRGIETGAPVIALMTG